MTKQENLIVLTFRIIIIMVFMFLFTSCVPIGLTPPGKIQDSDLISKRIVLNTSISKSLNLMYKSMRYCGDQDWRDNTLIHYGADPECIQEEDGSFLCDIYLNRGRHEYGIIGIIQLTPNSEGTIAVLNVFKTMKNPENTLNAWEQFLRGNAKNVCP